MSCGIAAGMAYTVVAHPFDTVKVAMQSPASHRPREAPRTPCATSFAAGGARWVCSRG